MKASIVTSLLICPSCSLKLSGGWLGMGTTTISSSRIRSTAISTFAGSSSMVSFNHGLREVTRRPGEGTLDGHWRRRHRSAIDMLDSTGLFQLQQQAGQLASTELTHISPGSAAILYGTGLLMSFSPCALSLLPLTMGYIAGTEDEDEDGASGFIPSAAFALGLATVLSTLGLSATLAGRVVGTTDGTGLSATLLPLAASAIAVVMGLNVLELVTFNLPSFEGGIDALLKLPRTARAFLLGSSSALVASPCCTPVLASILGFVASSQDPLLGLCLLLSYSVGYTTPLMIAGTASGALSKLMSAKGLTWITPASGALLISYGTYSGLTALFGEG
ncbi:unnamed protein product [Choristocarpus tenellus]